MDDGKWVSMPHAHSESLCILADIGTNPESKLENKSGAKINKKTHIQSFTIDQTISNELGSVSIFFLNQGDPTL